VSRLTPKTMPKYGRDKHIKLEHDGFRCTSSNCWVLIEIRRMAIGGAERTISISICHWSQQAIPATARPLPDLSLRTDKVGKNDRIGKTSETDSDDETDSQRYRREKDS
jgi:hypothetical protein